MEDTRRLAALRDQVALFEGETLFEGWAAGRMGRVDRQPGLALLTNWRLIITDTSGGFSAIPIAKIDRIDLPSPTSVRIIAWYETISLRFESAATAATLVNRLRQDPDCHAMIGPTPRQAGERVCTIEPTPCGPGAGTTDQRLLMGKPSS